MRQRAAESDVVIVNHHLLCADAALRHQAFGEVIPESPALVVDEPFILVTPTYGGGQGRGEEKGAVPKQVIRFLNDERNRRLIRGVISAGNTNFGEHFCLAGDIISRKCHVPHLYRLEVFGTPEDVQRVSEGLERWWEL